MFRRFPEFGEFERFYRHLLCKHSKRPPGGTKGPKGLLAAKK